MRKLVLLLVVGAAACSGDGGGGEAEATTTTVRRTTAVEAPLEVGQCGDVAVTVGAALDPAKIEDKRCTEPHLVEVSAVFDYPAGPDIDFPSAASVDGYARDQCIERFEPYVGTSYLASVLDFVIVAPDEDGWDDGDRRIACVLYHTNFEPLTGPAEGSAL